MACAWQTCSERCNTGLATDRTVPTDATSSDGGKVCAADGLWTERADGLAEARDVTRAHNPLQKREKRAATLKYSKQQRHVMTNTQIQQIHTCVQLWARNPFNICTSFYPSFCLCLLTVALFLFAFLACLISVFINMQNLPFTLIHFNIVVTY